MEIIIRIKTPSRWEKDYLTPKIKKLIPESVISYDIKKTTEILISNYLKSGELRNKDKLRYLIIPTSGTENIPLKTVLKRGITIIQNKNLIAKNVTNYLCDMIRKVTKSSLKSALRGKTILLLGFGNIGKEIYHRFSKYNCKFNVIKKDPSKDKIKSRNIKVFGGLKDLKKATYSSDIIINVAPRIAGINDIFKKYGVEIDDNALIINISRSGIINERKILDGVVNGIYSGAILDVYSKDIKKKDYSHHPNIILTPHIAGIYLNGAEKIAKFIAKYKPF